MGKKKQPGPGDPKPNVRLKIRPPLGTSPAVDEVENKDSSFGKRSEVKDAHDRYANIEVDYLGTPEK